MKIFPSILAADLLNVAKEIKLINNIVDGIHFDVMDGLFVPNITFGADLVNSCRNISKLFFDIHFMVRHPDIFVQDFHQSDLITFHYEVAQHPDRLIKFIKSIGKKVGIALLPSTSHEILKYIADQIDLILIMSVNPGFSGQEFLQYSLNKAEEIKNFIINNNLNIKLQMDGGIKINNIRDIAIAGVDIAVVGSGIFQNKKNGNYIEIMEELRRKSTI